MNEIKLCDMSFVQRNVSRYIYEGQIHIAFFRVNKLNVLLKTMPGSKIFEILLCCKLYSRMETSNDLEDPVM